MQSWSNACAITQREINFNDNIFVATMRPNPKDPTCWSFVIPPLHATLKDSGEVFLKENYLAFMLKQGNIWRPITNNFERGLPVCFHKHIFKDLRNVPIDSLSRTKISVGRSASNECSRIKTGLLLSQKKVAQIPSCYDKNTKLKIAKTYSGVQNMLGKAHNEDILIGFPQACRQYIEQNSNISLFMGYYHRAYILHHGSKSIKAPLTPVII